MSNETLKDTVPEHKQKGFWKGVLLEEFQVTLQAELSASTLGELSFGEPSRSS